MFRVPFITGTGWTAEDDTRNAHVAVITRGLADKLFGVVEVVGRTIRVESTELRITGVIENWRPTPHFYDLNNGAYSKGEQLFIPFSTSRELKLSRSGNMNCWGESADAEAVGAPCEWIQFWVELNSTAKAAAYRDYLVRYSQEQKTAGRFELEPNVRLRDVIDWLDFKQVVPRDARLQTWIALGFLLVCLINTVGLLLTKFLRRSAEIGVRRALGASKRVDLHPARHRVGRDRTRRRRPGPGSGLARSVWRSATSPRATPSSRGSISPCWPRPSRSRLVSSLLAGLLPAWRGCQVTPAIQLKSH